MVSRCLRNRSTQKTFCHLGKSEHINLWSKACIKNRFSFNFSILSRGFSKFFEKRTKNQKVEWRVNQFSFFNGDSTQAKRMAIAGHSSGAKKRILWVLELYRIAESQVFLQKCLTLWWFGLLYISGSHFSVVLAWQLSYFLFGQEFNWCKTSAFLLLPKWHELCVVHSTFGYFLSLTLSFKIHTPSYWSWKVIALLH